VQDGLRARAIQLNNRTAIAAFRWLLQHYTGFVATYAGVRELVMLYGLYWGKTYEFVSSGAARTAIATSATRAATWTRPMPSPGIIAIRYS